MLISSARSTQIPDQKLAKGANKKNSQYTAAILKGIKKHNKDLSPIFLVRFKANLSRAKNLDLASIKPAAHQALNDLIREGVLSAAVVKKVTRNAWKLVFKSARKLKVETEKAVVVDTKSVRKLNSISNLAKVTAASQLEIPPGFLWKPISDNPPHALAILLPAAWTGEVEAVNIIDPESGAVLAAGRNGGVGNGDREHFRFDQQGGSFPTGALVRVRFRDGSEKEISIEHTEARTEGR